MKIKKRFRFCSKSEYFHFIRNHKKFTDFNTLGLYRSILENKKLCLEDQQNILAFANTYFQKTFEFLQLKDPETYLKLITLGQSLTTSEEHQHWLDIRKNQERILTKKKVGHRNFGVYSRHTCGYTHCTSDGLMTRPKSPLAFGMEMRFKSDKSKTGRREKARRLRKARKNERAIIESALDLATDEHSTEDVAPVTAFLSETHEG